MYDNKLIGMFVGTIDEVLPPSHTDNFSKYQYEYIVRIITDNWGQLPTRCIKMDYSGGSKINYEEEILDKGCRVFVEFPKGERSCGVIIGGSRLYTINMTEESVRRKKTFNLVDEIIDKNGKWTMQTRMLQEGPIGPNISMDKDKVRIGDNLSLSLIEDSIEIDRTSRTITIKTSNWTVNVKQNANITVIGDVSITCKNADVKAANSVNVTTKTLDAKVVEAKIVAAKSVDIKATEIKFNGGLGNVITTLTQPTCYITGIPFIGSPTVKAT